MVKKLGPGGVELGKDGLPLQTRGKGGKFVKTPPKPTLLKQLENAAKQKNLDQFSKKSYDWYRNRVRTLGGQSTRDKLLKDGTRNNKARNKPSTGYMYYYAYDAKHKATLPYFDAFPLILMVGPAPKGFYGVNLHYLPPKARVVLFDKLLDVTTDNRYNLRTKFLMSYEILNTASKYSAFKPAFKRYLFSQMRSKAMLVPANQWEAALFMPVASFQGASNSKVWSDTILKGK